MAEFEEALGGRVTPGQRLAIQRAAILTALAEDKRVRSLAGEPINLDDLVRVDRLAMQAVSQLGISIVRQPKQETLADYVRARAVGAAP